MSLNEADTRSRYITPQIREAGWDLHSQISQEKTLTPGEVRVSGDQVFRGSKKVVDYALYYRKHIPIAVVEAKAIDTDARDGMQQALTYAEMLDVPFAYATNGKTIIERDFQTGKETQREEFPSPEELWRRKSEGENYSSREEEIVTEQYSSDAPFDPRYYQTVAINRTVEAIATGQDRALLTLATGTGKSFIAFQICYRLWEAKWNRDNEHRRPKILYLADRNVLVNQPMLGIFSPFGDAIHQIEGEAVKSRDVYFSTYQQIAEDERRSGLYKEYDEDFFDLVVVDECHRGSAHEESVWRNILEYFDSAAQLGMTATPRREENRDTYEYFGDSLIEYSLKKGIEDGFLAPYRVRRISTDVDATGWRPATGQTDRYGREIPDDHYETNDFERNVVLSDRTTAIARYISDFLKNTDRFDKTIVFCVDQEHAARMREALVQENEDIVSEYPHYVCRITSDEGQFGQRMLERFQDVDEETPVIATTSDMLTTGVDIPTVQNIALCRVVRTMSTFKQMIGRGSRLRPDYGKYYFSILDFTGAATQKFADPEFDGFPSSITEQDVDEDPAEKTPQEGGDIDPEEDVKLIDTQTTVSDTSGEQGEKFYIDGQPVRVAAEVVYKLDEGGDRHRVIQYTEFAKEQVESLFDNPDQLRQAWADPNRRREVENELQERGVSIEQLRDRLDRPDADAYDLLCSLAFDQPIKTRDERVDDIMGDPDFWENYDEEAREILSMMLEKYRKHGASELRVPDILETPPIRDQGSIIEITEIFGGPDQLKGAVSEMQKRLYG